MITILLDDSDKIMMVSSGNLPPSVVIDTKTFLYCIIFLSRCVHEYSQC